MLTENTVTKLQEMHLSAMAKAFKDQLIDPNMAEMSFEDRFGLLVDHEWTTRKNNHLKRLIKNAGFAESNACVKKDCFLFRFLRVHIHLRFYFAKCFE